MEAAADIAPRRAPLTAEAIEHIKPGGVRREIPDGEIRGMYLVVQPSGAKSYCLRYRLKGKPYKLTLGPVQIGLDEARKLAARALVTIATERLASIDRRTALTRRVDELRGLFTGASDVEPSRMRKLRIDQAAYAIAVAEHARARYLRNEDCNLDELVRAERRADAAVKRLDLPPEQRVVDAPQMSLADKLALKYPKASPP